MFLDFTYILVLIGALLSFIASMNVKTTFNKYKRIHGSRGIRAYQAAEMILHSADIYDVRIEMVRGELTDHYSPGEKVLRLSESVYNSESVASIGVAAHECGHAIQHKVGYAPLNLRSVSVPVVNIGSRLSWPVILLGLAFGSPGLANIGVILFLFVVLFQLITLPVEFNASRRALSILNSEAILSDEEELKGARKVLTAAALTYVAAFFSSILQLLRLLIIVNGRRDRR